MAESQIEEIRDVLVVERVVSDLAFLAVFDELHLPQRPQRVRNRRLRNAEQIRDVADAQFLFRKRERDPDARRVAQNLKSFGERGDRRRRLHRRAHVFDLLFVNELNFTSSVKDSFRCFRHMLYRAEYKIY